MLCTLTAEGAMSGLRAASRYSCRVSTGHGGVRLHFEFLAKDWIGHGKITGLGFIILSMHVLTLSTVSDHLSNHVYRRAKA